MGGTQDTNEDGLDPREAAALLDETRRRAQRQFDFRPPLLMLTGGLVALAAYGSVWLSVRGEDPYTGPTTAGLIALYSILALWWVGFGVVFRRATRGVGGRSADHRRAEAFVFGTVWVCVYVFQGALQHAGVGDSIVYGIYPAAAPILIVGAAAAGHEVASENYPMAAIASIAVAIAAVGAFAGPVDVWGVMGLGLCALLVCRAAIQFQSLKMGSHTREHRSA
jgi:hypothetical protein